MFNFSLSIECSHTSAVTVCLFFHILTFNIFASASSKVNSRLLSKSRFCPMRVKDHNPQCEVFFLKCQQNVFWHRSWVIQSCGFARDFCRCNRSRKWGVRAVGSKGREGRDNSVTWKGRARVFQQGGLMRRRKTLQSQSSSSSCALPSTTCCLARIFSPDCVTLHFMGRGESGSAHGAGNGGAKAAPTAGEGSGSNPWEQVLCSCCHWGVGRRTAVSSGGWGEGSCMGNYSFSCPWQLLALVGFAGQDSALFHFVSHPLYQTRDNLLFRMIFRNSLTHQQQDLRQMSLSVILILIPCVLSTQEQELQCDWKGLNS